MNILDKVQPEELLCRRFNEANIDEGELSPELFLDSNNDLSVDAKRNRNDDEMLLFQEDMYEQTRRKGELGYPKYLGFSEVLYKDCIDLNFDGYHTPSNKNKDHCSLILRYEHDAEKYKAALKLREIARNVYKNS